MRSRNTKAVANHPKDESPARRKIGTPFHLKPSENLQKGFETENKADGPKGVCPLKTPQRLSEKDLQSLYEEVMESACGNAKRPRSKTPLEDERPALSSASYRNKHLKAVQIYIHVEPPEGIRVAVDRIVKAEISKPRQIEHLVMAEELRDCCFENVTAGSSHYDFVMPLKHTLNALHIQNLCFREKMDWREELKPVAQKPSHFDLGPVSAAKRPDVDEGSAPPSKRCAPSAERNPIRTPRPDVTIGINLTPLISALSSRDLNEIQATELIDGLQERLTKHELRGPPEPMLISRPIVDGLHLSFPFAVVESNPHSTSRQLFDAENKAAVSAACALKMQLDLDKLASANTMFGGSCRIDKPPLFFSITTEGPIIELWYHWTVVEHGVRRFRSHLLDSYNALLQERGVDFVGKLHNVCNWGTGRFMGHVADLLAKVAEKYKLRRHGRDRI